MCSQVESYSQQLFWRDSERGQITNWAGDCVRAGHRIETAIPNYSTEVQRIQLLCASTSDKSVTGERCMNLRMIKRAERGRRLSTALCSFSVLFFKAPSALISATECTNFCTVAFFGGDPGGTRTPNTQFRRLKNQSPLISSGVHKPHSNHQQSLIRMCPCTRLSTLLAVVWLYTG